MRFGSLMAERIRSRVFRFLLPVLSSRLSILASMSSILVLMLSTLRLIEIFRLLILLAIYITIER